ncbi:MAG TPA: SRPBCC family protein [Gaiellaceae bacterium]
MQLHNRFDVPVAPGILWELLMDVPEVIPCMPGAQLAEILGPDAWRADVTVKLGPISLRFASEIVRENIDAEAHAVRLNVRAKESRGRGGATMTIDSSLAPAPDGTAASIVTEVELQGSIASYGAGVMEEVASELTDRFAACIAQKAVARSAGNGVEESASAPAAEPSAPPGTPAAAPTRPVGGLGLIVRAIARRLFRRRRAG